MGLIQLSALIPKIPKQRATTVNSNPIDNRNLKLFLYDIVKTSACLDNHFVNLSLD